MTVRWTENARSGRTPPDPGRPVEAAPARAAAPPASAKARRAPDERERG
ncbi:hypothetical protein [Amycolatopsis vancoresmycina]|nr:hypothetical protein [Amycolatopsis vancoresmycina]